MASLEALRNFYKRDAFATGLGIQIDWVEEDACTCSVAVTQEHKNAFGGVQGGLIFTLADFAFAVAANQEISDTVTVSSTIHFLSIAKGTVLTAQAVCLKKGRALCHYHIDVTDDTGAPVAAVTIAGYKTGRGPRVDD